MTGHDAQSPRLDPSEVNRSTWGRDQVVQEFVRLGGWTDLGEERALHYLAPAQRGGRLLDIGVGAGRTASMFALLTGAYVGIDFVPAMVKQCQTRFPDLDIRPGDARELVEFPDGTFDTVVFSFNGLDAIDHEGRKRALLEMARVLDPAGALLFSTLNLNNRFVDERPWQVGEPGRTPRIQPRKIAGWVLRLPLRLPNYIQRYRNYFANARGVQNGEGWGLRPLSAHDFGLLVHYVSLSRLIAEVAEAGLKIERIYASDGNTVDPRATDSDADYFHVICRLMSYQHLAE
jgi:SAM-dependent methyltransferase